MRIVQSRRLIYFSIPKTASESVRDMLDPFADIPIVTYPKITRATPFYNHMRPAEALPALEARGVEVSGWLRLATVRNPWARLASLYHMAWRNRRFPDPDRFGDWLAGLDPSGAADRHRPEKWYAHGVMSMTAFLSDAQGRLLVDRVFRVEDQATALCATLSDRLETVEPLPLPRINQARQSYDWREMYDDPADRDRVARLYAEDIARFGYTFDGPG